MSQAARASDPLRDELKSAIEALSATVTALTQVTQVLRETAEQMMQSVRAEVGPAADAPAVAVINVWDDDPFSDEPPSANPVVAQPRNEPAPSAGPANLPWRITGNRQAPAQHPLGTAEFRYWNAEASLARGTRYWADFAPQQTRWSTVTAPLTVALEAGDALNANYSRLFGLRFYRRNVLGISIFSGESPDIVCHELGHAVLDAIRPQLFHAASIEVDAFHEAFGDISAMLAALQVPAFRKKILDETQGRLRVNSRLSRIGEQLGWGIRQRSPAAVDPDCLRNAANQFLYQTPTSLLPSAPATVLSTEAHSFARVFTGAVLDALAGMVDVLGPADDAHLETVSRDLGQLLIDGVLAAPITPTYFSQVAAAVLQAAKIRHAGRYREAVRGAFVRRGILDLVAVRNLDDAPLPSFQPVDGTAGITPGMSVSAAPMMLGYGAVPEGYQSTAADAPGLPVQAVHAEFLDQPILCQTAAEQERFAVAPSEYGSFAGPLTDATESAKHFLATLIQLGRIDPGPAPTMMRGPTQHDPERLTHQLEAREDGLALQRIQFRCCPISERL